MSEEKRLPEETLEKCESESHNSDKSKEQEDLVHNNKSKRSQNTSKQQNKDAKDSPEDPSKSNNSAVHSSSGAISTPLEQALVALITTELSGKVKSQEAENNGYRRGEGIDREFLRTDREVQASSNVIRYNTGYYADILKRLHTASGNTITIDYSKSLEVLLRGQRDQQDSSHRFIQKYLMVSSDGDGDYDPNPEHTKLTADSILLGGSFPSSLYLMKLGTTKEICNKVQAKAEKIDFSKTMKPMINKYSWSEENEESDVSTYASEEEENEGVILASPDHCAWGDIDDIIDQSAVHGQLDDHVQQFNDAQAAQAEDQDEDEDKSVTNDSSSGAQENSEGGTLLKNNVSVRVCPIAEGIVAEESSHVENGSHELAGKGLAIPVDLVPQQSEMAGKQPYPSSLYTQIGTTGIKHYLLTSEDFAVTPNDVIGNLTVEASLQDPLPHQQENYNHGESGPNSDAESTAIEQTAEPPSSYYFSLGQTVATPTTMKCHSLYEFPQPEGHLFVLPNEVDTPTEDIPEESYFDAVEAVSDEQSEENENFLLSSFKSSPAENIDNNSEEFQIERREQSIWLNCSLL